jgi:hypothetical protein
MAEQIRYLTGAIPTPRHKLAAASPYRILGDTPTQFLRLPKQMSYWLNNQYGNCVSAEEGFAKACEIPEIMISDATMMSFCRTHNLLNGAMLLDVIQLMQTDGFHQGGVQYMDGTPSSVDYTNKAVLQNAIWKGPVKIGVAAGQLMQVVQGKNGWFGTSFRQDGNMDHCTSLPGYGPIGWLAQQMGVSVPSGVDPNEDGWAFFTWCTVGIVNTPSLLNITSEGWLRTPTTLANPPLPKPPDPTPVPVPGPTPTPIPW